MEYRQLGRTGVRVSCIGLGCGGFGGIGSEASLFGRGENQQQAFALMDRAVELDINYFDTADGYGGGLSEEMVGQWMTSRAARDSVVLATKVFVQMGTDLNSGGLSRRHIMRAVDDSLRRLQTDRIDLYMAHQVDPLTALDETMQAFADLVQAGKVLYLGFCNIEPWRVIKSLWTSERLRGARLECVQNEYNLLHRAAEAEMLPVLAAEGVSFTAYSPLAGGWLTGKYRQGQPPPPGSRMALRPDPYADLQTEETHRSIERLRALAGGYGTTTGSLALAWAASHPQVTSVLAAPRNLEQFETVAGAVSLTLDGGDRRRIAEALVAGADTENDSLHTA
ncbi:MAG TPA: aldo/keto reductase [Candidatus Dormibacteraeota bacterium]